ncbi:MAG TPA: 1,4-dihydroxy-2-naphthoate octaprenyltransferase, partial [Burkholderiaceae bacterium]|nr:1,4-dihydroxy-2-naphthoate octaprenyltransferase [Burkholderiaceae bacterium]
MSAPTTVRAGSAAAWRLALRPRTLLIAVVPVVVGTAFAQRHAGDVDLAVAALALAVSLLLQAIVNLQNDVGYTVRGGEHVDRVGAREGLPRATALGVLSVRAVRVAIVGAVALALLAGLPLVARAGAPAAALGLLSIAAALAYMGGPRPIAYTPFGELTVLAFFGWAACAGTFYVLTLALAPAVLLAATAIGMLAGAVLAVNNLRDAEHDRASGRRTFAVCFGARAARRLYAALLWTP